MNYYTYCTKEGDLIRIKSSRKPGLNSIPRYGTWIAQEYHNGEWQMPAFPEILWGTLKSLNYLGCQKI